LEKSGQLRNAALARLRVLEERLQQFKNRP
jgi:hypothetical protein